MKLKTKKKEPDIPEINQDEADHMFKYSKYYEPDVLDYEAHYKFVMNIEFYAENAGVPLHFLYHSAKDTLTEDDLEYINNWRKYKTQDSEISGALFHGDDSDIMTRMYSMVGWLLRNFVDAKVMTSQEILSQIKKGHEPDSTAIFIPNFCLDKATGGNIASWDAAEIMGWLLSRHGNGKQTVVYAQDKSLIKGVYGSLLTKHIKNHFQDLD